MLEIKSLKIRPKKIISIVTLVAFIVSTTFTFDVRASEDKIVYPLKEISKLKCRFNDFDTLKADCKRDLPILKTKDYKKYIKQNGGYNEYTRIYTVLWGASYKYGWDAGQGGHTGLDIATAKGTPVYNIAEGVVIVAKKDPSRGNIVSVKHMIRGKEITSNYAHMSKINVKKGQKIKAGVKVGEVGSTGNSTGNHLHFQLDLAYPFHPYYYAWKACPYSYYKITETGVCFDVLANNTLDPIEFLENNGKVLDSFTVTKINKKTSTKKVVAKKYTSKKIVSNTVKGFDMNIFQKTVHNEMGSTKTDVKAVQKIYKDLGFYKGKIDGDYKKVESAVIAYQLSNKVISKKSDNGAGWFGPKTRAHTKSSYLKYLNTSNADKRAGKKVYISNNKTPVVKNVVTTRRKIEKISRKNILTREEIQSREVNEFIKDNEINFKLQNVGGNIKIGTKFKIEVEVLKIVNRKKRRAFKGTLPAGITFEIDEKIVSVFPKKITHISNGTRDIQLKGLKSGNTTLKVKLGNKVIKTYKLKVFGKTSKIFPKTVQILGQSKITLGETKTAMGVFKDSSGKKLVKLPFNGTFILETGDNTKVCIKKGSLKDLGKIYRNKCRDTDFVKNPEVTYRDTADGILIFDYKVTSKKESTLKIVGKNSGNIYSTKKLSVSIPKGLTKKYDYYNETIEMLEKGIVSGTNKGYFMEERELRGKDALIWIENTLVEIKNKSTNPDTKAQINKKLVEIKKDKDKKSYTKITRKKFLEKAYKYLVINDNNVGISIQYKDLQTLDNKKANTIFDKNNTWKDKFGKTHFRPNERMTRGEGAYLLSKALNKTTKLYLTLK